MKWTKEFNKDIIRCYFNTILRIPNQPYRKEFYDRWVRLHPENPLTEQRICDQQRIIMRKVNTRENTRGSWLTQIEIEQIQNLITHQINDEINNHTNEPENAVQQINIPTADNNVEENATHTQEISEMIAEKSKATTSLVSNNIRTAISFSLVRSTIRYQRVEKWEKPFSNQ